MFSRWIVMNITPACGTLHCRKIRIPCGDQLMICGRYLTLTANIGQFKYVTALFISFFEGRMFSRWIVTNITSTRGT
jgi:hypothetical protein